MSEYKWIALYTKPNQEQLAIENIKRQSYDVYCPMVSKTRRHARKTEMVRRPLFPSYLFVRLNVQCSQWRPLLSTRGVQSLVKFGERLGEVPLGFISDLRAHEDSGVLDQLIQPKVAPGDKVEIMDGPFKNLIAQVVSLPEKDRVWLLLDMMGQSVRISQKVSALEAV